MSEKHQKAKELFQDLYKDVKGSLISRQARDEMQTDDKSFVYGEVLFDNFVEILSQIPIKKGSVFYDLGCGTGKACLCSHLMFPFGKVKGVELLTPLFNSACFVQSKLKSFEDQSAQGSLEFINADMKECDVSDGDVIYLCSTCFSEDLMQKLEEKMASLKEGAWVISLTRSLSAPYLKIEKQNTVEFSWGQATVYYQKKI